MKKISIALIGLGTVGRGVVKVLKKRRLQLTKQLGIDISLDVICEKTALGRKDCELVKGCTVSKDALAVARQKNVDILIELIGGIHPAKKIIIEALKNGKHVVTANKALLAEQGDEIFLAAQKARRELRFEASVAGGVPIIKALREGFVANQIDEIYGILNGTSNYILTSMEDRGYSFSSALKEAQEKGYAERNPGLDIDGVDAAHKISLLALLAFNKRMPFDTVYREGIRSITLGDILYARELGAVIKLLAVAKRQGNKIDVRVHPTLIPIEHPLSSVRGAFNAVFVKGDLVGETLFFGQGAGEKPTASAVVSDVVDLAKEIAGGLTEVPKVGLGKKASLRELKNISDIETKYYIRFQAIDQPGVLAQIAKILGAHAISISSVLQQERNKAKSVPVIMITHEATEKNIKRALKQIEKLNVIKGQSVAIRMERLS
ncbi:MAG: homoserine dehydrogenase [Candidatus Omnitrophica bacterium]|nr:homoserine dehydrogenase [Candidatus Omnitrophota bacterium]